MLVLTRKTGQQILMDKGRIQMKVIKVEDDVISIGIEAPLHIDIARQEVFINHKHCNKVGIVFLLTNPFRLWCCINNFTNGAA